jgi:Cu/Ag efflux pump CusA
MRDRSKTEFLNALRRDFSLIPGTNITIGQPISHRIDHMLAGTRANIAVKIFGEYLYTLRALGEKVRQTVATVPGAVDVSVEQQIAVPILGTRFDRQAMARYGVMVEDVARTLEAALQGVTVSRILEGRYAFDLVVRQAEAEGWNPDTLGHLLVDTPDGAKIPLQVLAQVGKTTGPNTISREQVERKIVVMCNVAG